MELPLIYENMLRDYFNLNVIDESFIGDYIEKTNEFDMTLVEEVKIDEYTLFLAKDEVNHFWLGLTSGERLCFNPEQQNIKYPCLTDNIKINVAKQFLQLLKIWIEKYGPILIGSYDAKKLKTYRKILSLAKFNIVDFNEDNFIFFSVS
jgi:hypothetical protein